MENKLMEVLKGSLNKAIEEGALTGDIGKMITSALQEVSTLKNKVAEQEAMAARKDSEIKDLKAEKQSLFSERDKANSKIAEMQKSIDSLSIENQKMQTRILQIDLEQAKAETQAAKDVKDAVLGVVNTVFRNIEVRQSVLNHTSKVTERGTYVSDESSTTTTSQPS